MPHPPRVLKSTCFFWTARKKGTKALMASGSAAASLSHVYAKTLWLPSGPGGSSCCSQYWKNVAAVSVAAVVIAVVVMVVASE